MMKRLLFAFILVFSSVSHAYEELTYNEFFEDAKYSEMFDTLKKKGMIKKVRAQMQDICKKWVKNGKDTEASCKCVSSELSKLSDKDLFYSSIMAFNRYQAKVAALKSKDKEKFEALKAQFKRSPLLPEKMESRCH